MKVRHVARLHRPKTNESTSSVCSRLQGGARHLIRHRASRLLWTQSPDFQVWHKKQRTQSQRAHGCAVRGSESAEITEKERPQVWIRPPSSRRPQLWGSPFGRIALGKNVGRRYLCGSVFLSIKHCNFSCQYAWTTSKRIGKKENLGR